MLRGISGKQLLELKAFEELEPFVESRIDWNSAAIMSLLANIHRDKKKKSKPFEVADFVLQFGGDTRRVDSKKKSWQQMKFIARTIALASVSGSKNKKKHG